MRTVGVEEEVAGGRRRAGASALRCRPGAAPRRRVRGGRGARVRRPARQVDRCRAQRQQVETDTPPRTDMTELEGDLRAWRDVAVRAARESRARIVASGTAPTEVSPQPHRDERYQRIMESTARPPPSSSPAAVRARGGRVRRGGHRGAGPGPWFPSLLAITGNSPFWQGPRDTHYASSRSQVIARWPSSGTPDVFGRPRPTVSGWRRWSRPGPARREHGLLGRPAVVGYPTLEVRIADVCLDVRDGCCSRRSRAGSWTPPPEWRDGRPPADVPSSMLRLASWQARAAVSTATCSTRTPWRPVRPRRSG